MCVREDLGENLGEPPPVLAIHNTRSSIYLRKRAYMIDVRAHSCATTKLGSILGEGPDEML